jgi:hypothetical protein
MYCNENSILLLFGISTPPTRTQTMFNLWTYNSIKSESRLEFSLIYKLEFRNPNYFTFGFGVLRIGNETLLENWGLEIIKSEGATGIASVCTILLLFFTLSHEMLLWNGVSIHHSYILIIIFFFQIRWFEFESPMTRFQFGLLHLGSS